MPGATPEYAIPYSALADLRSALPSADAATRARVQALLDTIEDLIPAPVYSTTNAPWTAATGFSITSGSYALWGPFVQLYLNCTRTGAAIAATATGDVANTVIATIKTGLGIRRPSENASGIAVYGGMVANVQLTTAGSANLISLPPNVGWAVNAYLAGHFFYQSASAPT